MSESHARTMESMHHAVELCHEAEANGTLILVHLDGQRTQLERMRGRLHGIDGALASAGRTLRRMHDAVWRHRCMAGVAIVMLVLILVMIVVLKVGIF